MKKGQRQGELLIPKEVIEQALFKEGIGKVELAQRYGCSVAVVYRLVKGYGINMPVVEKQCERCGEVYIAQKAHGTYLRQKFCSSQCRSEDFKARNPTAFSSYNKKHRLSKPLLCRYCDNPIPSEIRKSGLVFCSKECRRHQTRINLRNYNKRITEEFHQFKLDIGCNMCGYNRYAGSLDFHHVDPSLKETRIQARTWKSQSKEILEEIAKCVLLCKNCHHELHNILRFDPNQYAMIITQLNEKTKECLV